MSVMSRKPREQDRRTARKIAQAKTAYMSNAKWRKLFSHIDFVGVSSFRATNSELIQHLNAFGKWPVTEADEGILIHGYDWG